MMRRASLLRRLIVCAVALATLPVAKPAAHSAQAQSSTSLLLAGGFHHSCAIVGGALYCWGQNDYGQIGDGTTTDRNTPVAVINMGSGVTAVATGRSDHTCAIKNGAAYCWGWDYHRQLGGGSVTTPVTNMTSGVTAIAAGDGHTCAIKSGALYCWGDNSFGELGDGTIGTVADTPVAVLNMNSDVTAVAAGRDHTCAVKAGALYCWGRNHESQLGDGTYSDQLTPTAVLNMSSGVTAVAAFDDHTCAIKAGALYCWGNNDGGQLGGGSTTTPVTNMANGVTAVATGMYHTCAIKAGGLYCWGNSNAGQLGDGSNGMSTTPVAAIGMTSDVTAVGVGAAHSLARKSNGCTYTWGFNGYGQLGNGTNTNSNTPGQALMPCSSTHLTYTVFLPIARKLN